MDNQQQIFPQCRIFKKDWWVCTDGTSYNTRRKDSGLSTTASYYPRLTSGDFLHRAVVTTFLGEIPPGMEVNHIDGNKENNSLENLEIVSKSENRNHSINVLKHSRYGGFISKKKKLKYEEVVELGSLLHNSYYSIEFLSKKYNISCTAVNYINIGRNYRWLTERLFDGYPLRSRVK